MKLKCSMNEDKRTIFERKRDLSIGSWLSNSYQLILLLAIVLSITLVLSTKDQKSQDQRPTTAVTTSFEKKCLVTTSSCLLNSFSHYSGGIKLHLSVPMSWSSQVFGALLTARPAVPRRDSAPRFNPIRS